MNPGIKVSFFSTRRLVQGPAFGYRSGRSHDRLRRPHAVEGKMVPDLLAERKLLSKKFLVLAARLRFDPHCPPASSSYKRNKGMNEHLHPAINLLVSTIQVQKPFLYLEDSVRKCFSGEDIYISHIESITMLIGA